MDYSRYDQKTKTLIETCERLTAAGDRGALRQLRTLKKQALAAEDYALIGFSEFYFANWYYDHSQYEQFQNALRRAIHALLRSDARDFLARAYNFFAIDAQCNDALDIAYSYYGNALKFADEEKSPYVTGVVVHNLASYYYAIGDLRKSYYYFKKSMALMEEVVEDSFYHRNLLIAYLSLALTSLKMGNFATSTRITKKIQKILDDESLPIPSDIMLAYHFFMMRYELVRGDRDEVRKYTDIILEALEDENLSLLEMDDVREFCYALMDNAQLRTVGRVIELVEETVTRSDVTHAMRLLAEIKVEYYGRMHDEKKYVEAMREQNRILIRQKKERAKLYGYSMNLISLVGELQEEEEIMRLENEFLQTRIITDDLTKIANRYGMDTELSRAFERAYRRKDNLGVEILDIDGFKQFNDIYGHQMGDCCLEKVAEILSDHAEKEGFFCARYGGDEFVVIYESKTDAQIQAITKKIDRALISCEPPDGKKAPDHRPVLSRGICNDVPREKTKPWDYLSEADRALYAEKGKKKKQLIIRKLPEFMA